MKRTEKHCHASWLLVNLPLSTKHVAQRFAPCNPKKLCCKARGWSTSQRPLGRKDALKDTAGLKQSLLHSLVDELLRSQSFGVSYSSPADVAPKMHHATNQAKNTKEKKHPKVRKTPKRNKRNVSFSLLKAL